MNKELAFDALRAAWEVPGGESDWLEFCQDFDWEVPATSAGQSEAGWILSAERVPEQGVWVIVAHGNPLRVWARNEMRDWGPNSEERFRKANPYWMPILPKPTEGGDGG